MDNRYEVIEWRGHKFDRMTIAALEEAERLLGHELVITQGSYNKGGVGASAGTHDGGGAVDVAAGPLPSRIVRILRVVGFAAWHRLPSEGPWGEHIHAVLIGNERLAPAAQRQVAAYIAGRNGLASNLPDATWRPSPIPTFNYQEDDVSAEDVWNYPIKNADPAGPAKAVQMPAGKVLTDMELNIDRQAQRLSAIEAQVAQILAIVKGAAK